MRCDSNKFFGCVKDYLDKNIFDEHVRWCIFQQLQQNYGRIATNIENALNLGKAENEVYYEVAKNECSNCYGAYSYMKDSNNNMNMRYQNMMYNNNNNSNMMFNQQPPVPWNNSTVQYVNPYNQQFVPQYQQPMMPTMNNNFVGNMGFPVQQSNPFNKPVNNSPSISGNGNLPQQQSVQVQQPAQQVQSQPVQKPIVHASIVNPQPVSQIKINKPDEITLTGIPDTTETLDNSKFSIKKKLMHNTTTNEIITFFDIRGLEVYKHPIEVISDLKELLEDQNVWASISYQKLYTLDIPSSDFKAVIKDLKQIIDKAEASNDQHDYLLEIDKRLGKKERDIALLIESIFKERLDAALLNGAISNINDTEPNAYGIVISPVVGENTTLLRKLHDVIIGKGYECIVAKINSNYKAYHKTLIDIVKHAINDTINSIRFLDIDEITDCFGITKLITPNSTSVSYKELCETVLTHKLKPQDANAQKKYNELKSKMNIDKRSIFTLSNYMVYTNLQLTDLDLSLNHPGIFLYGYADSSAEACFKYIDKSKYTGFELISKVNNLLCYYTGVVISGADNSETGVRLTSKPIL